MIDFEALQKTVIDTLKTSIPEILVDIYPDKPDEYELTHPEGVILVYFAGAEYQESVSKGAVIQKGKVNFGVSLCLVDLVNNEKALPYLLKMLNALLGLEVTNYSFLGRMQLKSVGSPAHDKKAEMWIYPLVFYMPHEIVQIIQ